MQRISYVKNTLNLSLRTALVAEEICKVDRSDSFYIANPYVTAFTAAIAAVTGTYALSTPTTTDDTLTITDQVTFAVHLKEFEETLSRIDLFASFVEEMKNAIADVADKFVLNKVLDGATGTLNTPSGGFTRENVPVIVADMVGKVAGRRGVGKGYFMVIESTELSAFTQAGMANGFTFADATLNNGFGGNFGGVKIYVVLPGTYVTATVGTLTATNSGHRLGGVSGVATYAAPRGIQYDEKKVTLLTGREISCWSNIGAKVWAPIAPLLVDITIV